MAAEKQRYPSDKPISAIFTCFDENIPYRRLQQLDWCGIRKVYILVSDEELKLASAKKITLFDSDQPQTTIAYYKDYLPKKDAHINFEIVNTDKYKTEQEKIIFFLRTTKSDNLLNLCFCKDKKLPWLGNKLFSDIQGVQRTTTIHTLFNFELFKKNEYHLPSVDERLSPESADELLLRATNPVLCYPMDDFDIVYYQALFKCAVEAIAVVLTDDDSENAKEIRGECAYLIEQYGKVIDRTQKAEIAYEVSHKQMYGNSKTPGVITQEEHKIIVEERTNAELAFPELIRKLFTLYRKSQSRESELSLKKE